MPGISFQKIVGDCELLSTNLKPHLPEMPHLQEESEALDALITRAKELGSEQQVLTGRLREITRLRQESEVESRDMRSRIAALLRGKLGFKNESLIGFGIAPRKRFRKKAQRQAPLPAPEPAAPSEPVTVTADPEPAG